MDYELNADIKKTREALLQREDVQNILAFIQEDEAYTIEQQIALTLIEAPTFEEQDKAAHFQELLLQEGLWDVEIDRHGNVIGRRPGTKVNAGAVGVEGVEGAEESEEEKERPVIVLDAHLDTVFPKGSVDFVERKDNKLYAPGICDDTRGLATILGVLRALNRYDVETYCDLLFVGSVEEEGMGGLGGYRKFLEDKREAGERVDYSINVDGSGAKNIVYEATGIRTMKVEFFGVGGHAMMAFGKVANPLHAASRAVAKIADIQVPTDPKTTFAVSNFHAGNDAGIHAIVQHAEIKINIRSNGQKELEELNQKVMDAIDTACKEETERWGQDVITYQVTDYVNLPAATQDRASAMCQSAYAAIEAVGLEPNFERGGATNASNPIAVGIPAVCLGGGGDAGGIHSLDEWFDTTDSYKGVQVTTILALLLDEIA